MKQKQMLSQDMTKKSKVAIPDIWNCLFCFTLTALQIPFSLCSNGILKTTKELASS